MMEKLIVKNFGPIKEAEIDLTKYVVFIGDTSTGKSVLAKLIAIFRDSFLHLSMILDIEEINIKHELKKYNIDFDISNSTMEYHFDDYLGLKLEDDKIKILGTGLKDMFSKSFSKMLDESIKNNILSLVNFDKKQFIDLITISVLNDSKSIYFPAERLIYVLVGNSLAGLLANNVALPDCYKDFAAHYEVARNDIKSFVNNTFNFSYNLSGNNEEVIYNDAKINLSQASSGMQSLIPLLLVLDHQIKKNENNGLKSLIFEEPEMNLFPNKQKKLLEYIIKSLSKFKVNSVITTHSPYILSVLDTLLLAKNTYNEHPELKEEIAAIVSEDKWIDYKDISVYEVKNDGTIKSIKNEEFKSIDTNAIDGVSDIISEQFDKLTELRYAQ